MSNNLALQKTPRSLPEGTAEIAAYYKDPEKALNIFRGFFESLSQKITNKSASIDEWELLAEFVERVIRTQTEYTEQSSGDLDDATLKLELEDVQREFDKRLHEIRGTSPEPSEIPKLSEETAYEIMEALNVPDTLEPTPEDLAQLEQELGDLESDEELMQFLQEELGKE